MLEEERQFYIHEDREIANCVIWTWLMGYEPGWSEEMYLIGPAEIVCWHWEEMFGLKPFSYTKGINI